MRKPLELLPLIVLIFSLQIRIKTKAKGALKTEKKLLKRR
jgi:hypothetical protein